MALDDRPDLTETPAVERVAIGLDRGTKMADEPLVETTGKVGMGERLGDPLDHGQRRTPVKVVGKEGVTNFVSQCPLENGARKPGDHRHRGHLRASEAHDP